MSTSNLYQSVAGNCLDRSYIDVISNASILDTEMASLESMLKIYTHVIHIVRGSHHTSMADARRCDNRLTGAVQGRTG